MKQSRVVVSSDEMIAILGTLILVGCGWVVWERWDQLQPVLQCGVVAGFFLGSIQIVVSIRNVVIALRSRSKG